MALGRSDLGAACLAVFRPELGRTPVLLQSAVSPGWRRRLEPWQAARAAGQDSLESLEQELVATARPVIAHRTELGELKGTVGGDETLALALCPLLDGHGEVSAWLQLEFEHHLLPSTARLVALARAWRAQLEDDLIRPSAGSTGEVAARERGGWTLETRAPDRDPRARFFHAFADRLAMKTARRRWWGFVFDGARPAWMASGGGALNDGRERPGGAHVLSRVHRCGVSIQFHEPDRDLSLHVAAGSGMAVPFVISGRVAGCFVVESERRSDFRAEDAQRTAQLAEEWGARLQVARFRAWHAERFDSDLYFDVEGSGFGRSALDFARAGRVTDPVVLSGAPGCGKEVLARWLHFERSEGDGVLEVLRGEATPDDELECSLRELRAESSASGDGRPRTLVIKELSAFGPRAQKALAHLLEASPPNLRVLVTLPQPLEEAAASGQLLRALAHRLCRLELFVPPLAERRGEIPGLLALWSERFAAEFGVLAPTWQDAALGLLWRQPWPGNLRELESLVYKLVLLHPGEAVGCEQVRRLAKRFKLQLLKKLPSRYPRVEDMLTALRLTRKQSGNINKTRAALYLGWDPDTLVARLRDAGLDPANPWGPRVDECREHSA